MSHCRHCCSANSCSEKAPCKTKTPIFIVRDIVTNKPFWLSEISECQAYAKHTFHNLTNPHLQGKERRIVTVTGKHSV